MGIKLETIIGLGHESTGKGFYIPASFKWGLPGIIGLSVFLALVATHFQHSRLKLALIHHTVPELAVQILGNQDHSIALADFDYSRQLRLVAMQTGGGLQLLAGDPPPQGARLVSVMEKFHPSFNLSEVKMTASVLLGGSTDILYLTDFDFFDNLVIGVSLAGFRDDLIGFFWRGFGIFLLISLAVYGFGQWLVWRFLSQPLAALVDTINAFSLDPSIARPMPDFVVQTREFTEAAKALDRMQRNTLIALRQRERLADIGEAVTKINHDIRNVLSAATLVTDALLASNDPKVRRSAPHVLRSLEQAVDLCQSMLDYLVEVPPPSPQSVDMQEVVDDLRTATGLVLDYDGPGQLFADRKILARILLNLARNAGVAGATALKVDVWRAGHLGVIDVSDNGPGVDEAARPSLFQAFKTTKSGGTGLGLAIARDLAVAHGGNLKLTRSNNDGSEFRLQLPDQIFAGADFR